MLTSTDKVHLSFEERQSALSESILVHLLISTGKNSLMGFNGMAGIPTTKAKKEMQRKSTDAYDDWENMIAFAWRRLTR